MNVIGHYDPSDQVIQAKLSFAVSDRLSHTLSYPFIPKPLRSSRSGV